jgi:hypothetical protein
VAKIELPYMPVVVDEERALAGDLTNEELGALYRIKLALWNAGGFLDENRLVRASRAGKRWGSISRGVLDHLTVIEGKVSCGSVLIALQAVRIRRAENAERAAKAANVRWSFARGHDLSITSGKPLSDALASQVSDTLLKSTKSLKSATPTMLGASAGQCSGDANQNQNDLATRTYTASAAPAAPQEGFSDQRARARGTIVNNDQRALLFVHGVELLMGRLGLKKLGAHAQISTWLTMVRDADRLAQLLGAADQENLKGEHFFRVVNQAAQYEKNERERGLALPLDQGKPRVMDGGREG